MKPYRLPRHQVLAGACVLVLAGLAPAAAQFPPAPGEANSGGVFPPPPGTQPSNAFPPPPGQAQRQDSAFPPPPGPGQSSAPSRASAPSGGFPAPGGFAAPASGGFSQPAPGGGFSGGGGGQQQGPSEAQKVCLTFPALREDVEKGAATIKAAGERKATREEVCPLFKTFAAKEAKMVKFLETNRVLCGVPANIIPQVKTNHAKTVKIRDTVCSAGPAGGPPAAPTLSDALGGPIIADDNSVKPGRGTFDTLTGNALQK